MPITRLIIAVWLVGVAALTSVSATAEDAKRPDKVSFYFAAHEDDWQLFMNPSAFQDVMNGAAKTVFIHVPRATRAWALARAGANIRFIWRARTARKPRSGSWRTLKLRLANASRRRCLSTVT
jgi:hypothetical protein